MYDELKAYGDQDFQLGKWRVHNPTLREIKESGEEIYWTIVCNFAATSFDERLYLWSKQIDYNSMTDWQVFCMRLEEGLVLPINLFFPDIEMENYKSFIDPDSADLVLIDVKNKNILTESDYITLTDYLRFMHGLKKNSVKDGNEATKQWRLQYELERLERRMARGIKDEFHSVLQPCISALTNIEGFKYNWHTVWDLPINVFYDALKRNQLIQQSRQLMQGLYSGCIDYKKLKNKDDLNWLRSFEINK